jgi:hypothetical protein
MHVQTGVFFLPSPVSHVNTHFPARIIMQETDGQLYFSQDTISSQSSIENAAEDWRQRAQQLKVAIQNATDRIYNFDETLEAKRSRLLQELFAGKEAASRCDQVLTFAKENLNRRQIQLQKIHKIFKEKLTTASDSLDNHFKEADKKKSALETLTDSQNAQFFHYENHIDHLKKQLELVQCLHNVANSQFRNEHPTVTLDKTFEMERNIKSMKEERKCLLKCEKELIESVSLIKAKIMHLRPEAGSSAERSQNLDTLVLDAEPGCRRRSKFESILYHSRNKHDYSTGTNGLSIQGHMLSDLNFLSIFSTRLKFLDLSRNNLKTGKKESIKQIASLKCLEVLNLSGNTLTEMPKGVDKLHNLKSLDVSGNAIKEMHKLELVGLKPLTQLFSLNCAGNPVARHDHYRPIVLKHLKHLIRLDGSDLKLVDFGMGMKYYNVHEKPSSPRRNASLESILAALETSDGDSASKHIFASPAMKRLANIEHGSDHMLGFSDVNADGVDGSVNGQVKSKSYRAWMKKLVSVRGGQY